MSEVPQVNRQPVSADEWQRWLESDEALLWFYPRQGETQVWSARLLWSVCSVVVASVALFDWLVPNGPSDRYGAWFHGYVAVGAFAFVMLVLDLLGVRTKPVADWLNQIVEKAAPRGSDSMRRGSSAISQRRVFRLLDGNFVALPLPDTAIVSGFRLLSDSLSNEGRVLLRDIGFREERRLDAALQLAHAIRAGRAETPA